MLFHLGLFACDELLQSKLQFITVDSKSGGLEYISTYLGFMKWGTYVQAKMHYGASHLVFMCV